MKYIPRISDTVLNQRLQAKGAVLIEGPKWCGKTSTAMRAAKSMLDLADLNVLNDAREMVQINPGI